MSDKLRALVRELGQLSREHCFPNLPPNAYPHMYVAVYERSELEALAGFALPEDLVILYSTAVFVTESWSAISFDQPVSLGETCRFRNAFVQEGPPMQAEAVRSPVVMGSELVPFAYYDDSAYCIDVAQQVVNVSWKKGKARVVAPDLEAFLAEGLRKWKREISKEQAKADKPLDPEGLALTQEMLRSPMAFMAGLKERFQAAMQPMPEMPASWTEQRRREHLGNLQAANPRRTPLQRASAELLTLYASEPELHYALELTLLPLPAKKRAQIEHSLRIQLPPDLLEFLDLHAALGVPWDNVSSLGAEDLPRVCRELRSSTEEMDWGLWPGTAEPEFGKGLLPLGADGDPVICYDLQPGPGGQVGQIVEVDFEQARCKVVSGSLLEYLSTGLERAKTGAT